MSQKIGPIFGGRIPRSSLRSGRCTPLTLETLENRVLLSGGGSSSSSAQTLLPPAVIATPVTVAPVPLQFPSGNSDFPGIAASSGGQGQNGNPSSGGGAELYQASPESDAETLQLTLSWSALPVGASGRLLDFDQTGNLLIDATQDTASESSTVNLGGPVSTSEVFYLAIQISDPTASGEISSQFQLTFDAVLPPPEAPLETGGNPSGSDQPTGVNSPGGGEGLSQVDGSIVFCGSTTSVPSNPMQGSTTPTPTPTSTQVPNGSTSTGGGNGTSGNIQAGGTTPGFATFGLGIPNASQPASPATLASWVGMGVNPTASGGIGTSGIPSSSLPMNVGPLPASQYQPAGGIFSEGMTAQPAGGIEQTRVELSLIRRSFPGGQESSGEQGSVDPSIGILSLRVLTTGSSPARSDELAEESSSPEAPRPSPTARRPFPVAASERPLSEVVPAYHPLAGLPSVLPDPNDTNDAISGIPWFSAAFLPPIALSDRGGSIVPTARRDGPAGDEDDRDQQTSRSGAILLGMSGSAALGVALYAPDLVAAMRRNENRRIARQRTPSDPGARDRDLS
jgi:hypothetical protein